MVRTLEHLIARPLISLWLNTSAHSWRRRVMAEDSPHVHARGTNPDRVLLAGDGIAAGRGVRIHELGLPGFLARSLSGHTGRATDVDIVVTGDMTAKTCLTAVEKVDLFRFDVIVLCLGGNEALALTDVQEWRTALGVLLDDFEKRAPAATEVFLLSIPFFGINPHFPDRLAEIVDRHVHELNLVMQELAEGRSRVRVIPLAHVGVFEPEGPHLYQWWADGISRRISTALDPARSPADKRVVQDESARQQAVDEMDIGGTEADPVLDSLMESARRAFATPIAALTIIDGPMQLMLAVSGMDAVSLPREQTFCDVTIQHASDLVVEDTLADSRYGEYTVVTGEPHIRFYAGYPIESPDGHRVRALCVMDTEPHQFTSLDTDLLRTLAQYAQERLWRETTPASSHPTPMPLTASTL